MKFSAHADVAAPVEETFAAFADFPRYVRMGEARGAKVEPVPAAHFAWRARFDWNGATRDLKGEVTRIEPPHGFAAVMVAQHVEGTLEIEVTALEPARSRVRVTMEWRPITMSGRILLQSLKLVKGRLDERVAARLAEFAAQVRAA
jgi:uncharacterized protein YndB with AHSA1/START domain